MRAPHAWLADDVSLYDRFGSGFALVCFDGGAAAEPFARAAAERRIPLSAVPVDDPAVAGLYDGRPALVRPDQVVAWHGTAADAGAVLDVAAGRAGQVTR
jgi:hypothetical protein